MTSHLFIRIAMLSLKAAARLTPRPLDAPAIRAHLPLLERLLDTPEERKRFYSEGAHA